MDIPNELYVVVTEGDGVDKVAPLVLETHVNMATKNHARGIVKRLNGKYGDTKIGRVTFNEIDQINTKSAINNLLCPDNTKIDELLKSLTDTIGDAYSEDGLTESHLHAMRSHMRLTVLLWLRGLQ